MVCRLWMQLENILNDFCESFRIQSEYFKFATLISISFLPSSEHNCSKNMHKIINRRGGRDGNTCKPT